MPPPSVSTLLCPSHVITAAHCMFNRDGSPHTTDTIAVMIGDHDINVMEPGQNVRTLTITFSPQKIVSTILEQMASALRVRILFP